MSGEISRERVATMSGRDDGLATLRLLRHGERYSHELARGALHDLEGPPATWVKDRFLKGIEANLCLIEALERSEDSEDENARGTKPA